MQHKPSLYYLQTAAPSPFFMEQWGTQTCDVCVVGGGYVGLSTAISLAEKGYKVVLLEAHKLGHAESGRNGGHLLIGYTRDVTEMQQMLGKDKTQKLWDVSVEAVQHLKDRIKHYEIDFQLQEGYLYTAIDERKLRWLEDEQKAWENLGYSHSRLMDKTQVQGLVLSDRYYGGLWDSTSGSLHPLRLVYGLAKAAHKLGVEIYEHSPAVEIIPGKNIIVRTPIGNITAKTLVLAGNAQLAQAVNPRYDHMVVGISHMGVTEPLTQPHHKIMSQQIAVSDNRRILDYYRLSADNRLVFGVTDHSRAADLAGHIIDRIVEIFPQLADVGLTDVWSGEIGFTQSRLPDIGRVGENVYYAQGFSGHGLALANFSGHLIAQEIHTKSCEQFNTLAAFLHSNVPGGRNLCNYLVPLVVKWQQLQDRF